MLKNVIVPVDLYTPSAPAVQIGSALGRRGGLDVHLVLVASPRLDHTQDETDLRAVAATVDAPHVRYDIIESNDVAPALVDAASSDGLLCLETHAYRGLRAIVIGRTTDQVLQVAREPLLLVGPSTPPDLPLDRLLACVDEPDAAAALIPAVGEWAQLFGLTVRVVHVWERRNGFRDVAAAEAELAGVVRRLSDEYGVDAECEILHGDGVADSVVADADRTGASVIAVAARRRSGLRARVLGHVAVAIAHDARAAVLAVPVVTAEGEDA